jgi:uncharacterized RDD family membrane protein YckC
MAFGDIVLLKDKTPLGPFTRTQIQAGLSRGEFSARDLAHTPGLRDWLPLLEVLHHLDREVVHWPRPRDVRVLPPLPYAPRESDAISESEARVKGPFDLPAVPIEKRPIDAPALPPQIPQAKRDPAMEGSPFPPVVPTVANKSFAESALTMSSLRPPSLPAPQPLEPSPLLARFFAWCIDWAVLFLPVLGAFGFAYAVWIIKGPIEHRDPETARQEQALLWRDLRSLVALVAIGFAWLYAAGLECSRWQGTIGKQAMGLKVTDAAGERLSFLRASGRHAAKYLSALPLFLGFMAALFNAQRLTWHDRLAATRVVKK